MANPVGRPRTTVEDLPQAGFQHRPPHDPYQPATGNISGCAFWIRAIANQTFTLLVRVFLLCYNERADRLASRQATSPSCFRKPFSVKLNGDSYENMYTLQKRKNHR